MGLGNNMGMGKAKGKSKPEIIKRVREVRTAKDYNSFTGSVLDPVARDACRLSPGSATYYHNGIASLPNTSNIIYQEKRARGSNRFGPGFIHAQDRGRSFAIEIDSAGVVQSINPC